jgi:hypothetical protein
MKQQTALDYYSKQIGKLTADLVTGRITGKQFVMLEIKLLEKAKEMQKQQSINDFVAGNKLEFYDGTEKECAEQYYEQTYGGNK